MHHGLGIATSEQRFRITGEDRKPMWRQVNNYIHSVQTYQDMSPDLSMRQQVNRSLRHRRPLSIEAWCQKFYQETQSQRSTLLFIYQTLEPYSGLEFNRVRPYDHLVNDLQFPLVCWFDWATSFCDDVTAHFDIDISDCFDETDFDTLAELIQFLENQLAHKLS